MGPERIADPASSRSTPPSQPPLGYGPPIRPKWNKQRFAPLSASEREWIDQHSGAAPDLIAQLTGEPATGEPTVQQLDLAWAAWFELGETAPEAVTPVINIFALAFGDTLVSRLGMEWVTVSDRHGTEMGVLGQPGDLLAFPASAVTKRWEGRELGFFVPMFEMFADARRRAEAAR